MYCVRVVDVNTFITQRHRLSSMMSSLRRSITERLGEMYRTKRRGLEIEQRHVGVVRQPLFCDSRSLQFHARTG